MKEQPGMLPPQAIQVESVVLGACMLEANAIEEIIPFLKAEMFYTTAHQVVFEAIISLHKIKQPVDILTVTQKLISTKKLALADGAYYVSQLTNRVASSANIQVHARIILELYMKRCLIALANDLSSKAYDEYGEVFEVIEYATKSIKDIDALVPTEKQKTNDEALVELNEDIASAESKGGIIGYASGNKALDFALTGLRLGNKYVIAALPGEGKTSLAKSIAIHLANVENIPGVFFSMEMTHKQLMMVALSQLHSISNEKIQRGTLTMQEKQSITDSAKLYPNFWKNFNIDDESGLSPEQIRRKLLKLVKEKNIKWFAVDYLQLAKLKGKEHKGKTREQVISDISSELKIFCKEFNLIGIELSQLTKEASKRDTKRPQLSDLKDSGAIEANADAVIFIYRPEKHGVNAGGAAEGFAELILAKNRYGRIMSVASTYIPHLTAFIENTQGIEIELQTTQDSTDF